MRIAGKESVEWKGGGTWETAWAAWLLLFGKDVGASSSLKPGGHCPTSGGYPRPPIKLVILALWKG